MAPHPQGVTIVYDGECPFCSAFAAMTRLKAAAGPVTLIDARQDRETAERLATEGFDLDEGMVVTVGARTYFGADAVNALALMSSGSGTFNCLVAALFRRPRVAALAYPALRSGRNLALRLLGRSRFAEGRATASRGQRP